ncbi:MAG: flagellar hook assembly protein FlgD [Thermoleophilia bacterium]|nr:flagellar hook assembly protein FlgD [Thermoleophilia bacterium]
MTVNTGKQAITIAPPAENATKARIVGLNEDASLQKDMFLKLMIAQLKNQDPTAPMDQKDMMASMTQFSQVEQMQNMTKAMETISLSQGVGLIGREIEYKMLDKNDQGQVIGEITFTGIVDHVKQSGGSIKLVLAKPPGAPDDLPATEISPADVTRVGGA